VGHLTVSHDGLSKLVKTCCVLCRSLRSDLQQGGKVAQRSGLSRGILDFRSLLTCVSRCPTLATFARGRSP
jgi:hypothetical protein